VSERLSLILSRPFQRGDVNLVHFHHRFHDAIRLSGVGISQHVAEKDRVDLPRETEFVFESAAPPSRSAVGGKFLTEIIDLILGLAVDRKRDRFGELELRAALSATNSTVERKFHRYHAALGAWSTLAVTRYPRHLSILKNAHVKFRRLFRFGIEPQKRIYLLHPIFLGGFLPGRKHLQLFTGHRSVITSAPGILAFTCLLASAAANLRLH